MNTNFETGYSFETTAEKIAEQAEVGVRPILAQLIEQRLQLIAKQLIETAKQDIDKILGEVALDISKSVESRIVAARNNNLDGTVNITIAINKKPVFTRMEREFTTEAYTGAPPR